VVGVGEWDFEVCVVVEVGVWVEGVPGDDVCDGAAWWWAAFVFAVASEDDFADELLEVVADVGGVECGDDVPEEDLSDGFVECDAVWGAVEGAIVCDCCGGSGEQGQEATGAVGADPRVLDDVGAVGFVDGFECDGFDIFEVGVVVEAAPVIPENPSTVVDCFDFYRSDWLGQGGLLRDGGVAVFLCHDIIDNSIHNGTHNGIGGRYIKNRLTQAYTVVYTYKSKGHKTPSPSRMYGHGR